VVDKYLVTIGDEEQTFELEAANGRVRVRQADEETWHACELERVGDSDLYLLMVDDRPTEIYLERRRGGAIATIGRHTFDCDVGPWRPGGRRMPAPSGESGQVRITAPMTGSIVEVRCAAGDEVRAGDVVLVIESMKMNNELRAPIDGTIDSIPVTAGQRVKANDLLVAIRRAA
jgi:biotin carboxyl carrier protein